MLIGSTDLESIEIPADLAKIVRRPLTPSKVELKLKQWEDNPNSKTPQLSLDVGISFSETFRFGAPRTSNGSIPLPEGIGIEEARKLYEGYAQKLRERNYQVYLEDDGGVGITWN